MNKGQKEFLEKVKKTEWGEELPLFRGIFIIPQRKLHDSGYKMMYVVGHTDYNEDKKDFDYYMLATYSDVIDFAPIFDKYIKGNFEMCDLHLDINKSGIIHIWTHSSKKLKCTCSHISSCSFEVEN